MNSLEISAFGEANLRAETQFRDGSRLVIVPHIPYRFMPWVNIEGTDSVLVYQQGRLEALATDRTSHYARDEERGFWSRGTISQQGLGCYVRTAVTHAQQLFDKSFAWWNFWAKKKFEREHQGYWRITTTAGHVGALLEEGAMQVFEKNPVRFEECLRPTPL